jgi:hypothetical protein
MAEGNKPKRLFGKAMSPFRRKKLEDMQAVAPGKLPLAPTGPCGFPKQHALIHAGAPSA